tara:strand:- start:1254 stop:1877 length:624 start_codon:yes stop_codon:yes gene_type:complete
MPIVSDRLRKSSASSGSSKDGFLNPGSVQDGSSVRFALLEEDAFDYYLFWVQEVNGKGRKPIRCTDEPTPEDVSKLIEEANERYENEFTRPLGRDGKNFEPLKMAASIPVFNHDTEKVQVFEWTQSTITEALDKISQMEDYADCMTEIDLVLSREGQGVDTRYSVNAAPRRKNTSAKIKKAWGEAQDNGFDIEKLIGGGNPFESSDD